MRIPVYGFSHWASSLLSCGNEVQIPGADPYLWEPTQHLRHGCRLHCWCGRWAATACSLNPHTPACLLTSVHAPTPSICTEPLLIPLWCKSGHFISLLKSTHASHFSWVKNPNPSKQSTRLHVVFLITVLDCRVYIVSAVRSFVEKIETWSWKWGVCRVLLLGTVG